MSQVLGLGRTCFVNLFSFINVKLRSKEEASVMAIKIVIQGTFNTFRLLTM